MKVTIAGLEIVFDQVLKHSRPGFHLKKIILPPYPDKSLCVVHTYKHYRARTERLCGDEQQLFLITTKPHTPAHKETIARWVRETIGDSGIDISRFGVHSTRSASVSRAIQSLPLHVIMDAAGWSDDSTFRKYYLKPITQASQFAQALLDTVGENGEVDNLPTAPAHVSLQNVQDDDNTDLVFEENFDDNID